MVNFEVFTSNTNTNQISTNEMNRARKKTGYDEFKTIKSNQRTVLLSVLSNRNGMQPKAIDKNTKHAIKSK